MGSAVTAQQVSLQSKVTGQFDTNTKLGGQKSLGEYTAWPDFSLQDHWSLEILRSDDKTDTEGVMMEEELKVFLVSQASWT